MVTHGKDTIKFDEKKSQIVSAASFENNLNKFNEEKITLLISVFLLRPRFEVDGCSSSSEPDATPFDGFSLDF